MPLSHNVQRVQPSVTMQISAQAAAMQRAGIDVVSLSAGEPDFDTPQNVKDAGIRAIVEGFTKYTTPGSGIIELKEAICRKFERDNGLVYTTDEVIVNNGAKHSLFLAVAALVNRRRRGHHPHAVLGDLLRAAADSGRRAGDC